MARANLGSLLSVASDTAETKENAQEDPPEAPAQSDAPEVPVSAPTRRARKAATPAPSAASKAITDIDTTATGTHYTEFERIEARLRDDQVHDLDVLVRRLNKQRAGRGERITRNTLLRVASDVLLAMNDRVEGATEDAIRTSVTT